MNEDNVKVISTKFERDNMVITINKHIDKEYDMCAGEIIVTTTIGTYEKFPHDTYIWFDDIHDLVTLRDALSSYIEQTGLEKKGGEQ